MLVAVAGRVMTESQWRGGDLKEMLKHTHRRGSERKRRLFATACCRRVWHLLTDDRSQRAVETAERYADGGASDGELSTAGEAAYDAFAALRDTGPTIEMTAANAVYGAAAAAGSKWDIA